MGHIEATEKLTASPDAVWKVISDPATWGEWFTIHERWTEEPPATLAAGSKLTAKIMMLGMANKIEWTVDDVEAPTTLVLSGTGMAAVKVQFVFELKPDGDGSELQISGDFSGTLIKGALAKAVEKDATSQIDKSLTKLDALAAAA
ncbi:type II toxin-antitoxin system Rv0910 family toxin [Gordonia iterans]